MKNRKINLDKLAFSKDIISAVEDRPAKQIYVIPANAAGDVGAKDHDTPTWDDNCCGLKYTTYNTFVTCVPSDWCGYYHESDCRGPLLTAADK